VRAAGPGTLSRSAGLVGVTAAFAVTMAGTTLPTPLYVLYRERFGFSQLMVTVIFATYAVGVIAALLLFGGLSDQVGRRRLLLPGLALSAASAVAFLVAQGLGLLFVGRLLSGLSAGIFTGTATATIVDLAPPGRQGRATLVATVANMGGLGCGPLLAGVLAQVAGNPLRLVFLVDLALLLPVAVAVWLMPEPVQRRGPVRLRLRWPRVPAEARAVFVSASLAGFAGFSVLGLFTAVAPAFLGEVLSVRNHAVVGLVVFAVFVASTAGQLLLERVSRRFALLGGTAALAVGMAVLAAGLAVPSLALLLAGGLIAGVGQGLSFRAGMAAVTGASPEERRAEVASAFFLVAYVAISLPVVGVGLLAEATSLRTAGLVFAGLVVALALLAMGLLARTAARE
jgi:MFS family permease